MSRAVLATCIECQHFTLDYYFYDDDEARPRAHGTCSLTGRTVYGDDPACPSFKPRR